MPVARIAVLIVEDEPLIRLNISDELSSLGYEVFEAPDAHQAVALLNRHPEIQVLFTDIDMPGNIDGLQLARLVRSRWPPIKIIVTSGKHYFTHADLPVEGKFVPKPYSSAFVVETICDVMKM